MSNDKEAPAAKVLVTEDVNMATRFVSIMACEGFVTAPGGVVILRSEEAF